MRQVIFGAEEIQENAGVDSNTSVAESSDSNDDDGGSESNNRSDEESAGDDNSEKEDSDEKNSEDEESEEDLHVEQNKIGIDVQYDSGNDDLEDKVVPEECDDIEEENDMESDREDCLKDIEEEEEGEDEGENSDENSKRNKGSPIHLSNTKLNSKGQTKPTKPGIIYLSRLAPFMNRNKLRQMFSIYGEVGRIFCQSKSKNTQKNGKKKKGNRARSFTEAWVEFKRKSIAKRVAITFNNTRISHKKRSRYYDELWNIKYLPKFQWAHLIERLEFEKQVRSQRIRTEVMQTRKETNFYLQNVEQQKVLERMKERKRKQGKEWGFTERQFKQLKTEEEMEDDKRMFQQEMHQRSGKVTSSVLGKIFKK